ncbi:MAG: DUF547 domain-containing protein [Chloroherpetonaceae bacterium]|nr:DUF547 domain-containing protein [Chloroherpetonaceae bacterium]
MLLTISVTGAPNSFDHSIFDAVLKKYVVNGKVNYKGLKQEPLFKDYLNQLEKADLTQLKTREEKIAFWINAYNAYTLKLILDNYPVKSIRDVTFLGNTIFGFVSGPWKKEFCKVGGKVYSLDYIEHEILRKELGEEKIHFAVNCASESCPILRPEAYRGERLKEQLNDQLQIFLSDTLKNQFKFEENTLYLSPIFDWYANDFKKNGKALLDYLKPYLTQSQQKILESGTVEIKFMDYDWSLNEVK